MIETYLFWVAQQQQKNVFHFFSSNSILLSSCNQDPCFHMVNKKYRFYISFENAICKDYITEKTFNALRCTEKTNWYQTHRQTNKFTIKLKIWFSRLNTIPIVLGGVNYTAELPPNSFINAAQFITPQGILSLCSVCNCIGKITLKVHHAPRYLMNAKR